jgi:hypothetical protein
MDSSRRWGNNYKRKGKGKREDGNDERRTEKKD